MSHETGTIEIGIAQRLHHGPADWADLESFTTDGYETARFNIAVCRMVNDGRIRAVGCEWGHGHRPGCRFEAVAR
ncbi:hypothetical protein [Dactylosporangium sp. CA-139066]|uniref:hypothetical protein n=1 Tax=Dactylosporangium sp. CA-139066 TaxID=3239930 RepID=UPI003D8CCE30